MSRTEVRTPRAPAPGAGGVEVKGGVAPDPRRRETADEAEVTLRERVAAEAEAGKTTGPTPSRPNAREGKGACVPPVRGGGKGVRRR